MTNSLYVYEDKWNNNKIVYLGKALNPARRHNEHLNSKKPSKFDRILRANPDRYNFKVIVENIHEEGYDELEKLMIWVLKKAGAADHNIVVDLDRATIEILETKES